MRKIEGECVHNLVLHCPVVPVWCSASSLRERHEVLGAGKRGDGCILGSLVGKEL